MDMHYIVPSDESLTKAMDRFTKWLDGELKLEMLTKTLTKVYQKTKNNFINSYEYIPVSNL